MGQLRGEFIIPCLPSIMWIFTKFLDRQMLRDRGTVKGREKRVVVMVMV